MIFAAAVEVYAKTASITDPGDFLFNFFFQAVF
jgi:hypothetical protein